jgi:WXG100 family type VII secretion target
MADRIAGQMGQMDALAKQFSTGAGDVQRLMNTLANITANTVGPGWEGRSARNFEQLWNTEFKSALTKLNAALQDASQEVTKRKHALIQADS